MSLGFKWNNSTVNTSVKVSSSTSNHVMILFDRELTSSEVSKVYEYNGDYTSLSRNYPELVCKAIEWIFSPTTDNMRGFLLISEMREL